MARNRIQHKKTVNRPKPEDKERVKGQPNVSEKATLNLIAMQQQFGNLAVQRALERQARDAPPAKNKPPLEIASAAQAVQTAPENKERSSAEVALDAKVPGAGSFWTTLLADFATVADTTLALAECAQFAVPAALGGSASFAAAVTFIASSLYGLADAYKAGEKLAAVMGEAYGILYIANLKDAPTAPGDWAAGASFNRAARDAQKRLCDVVKKGGKPAGRMLGFLYNLRQNSEQGLNDLYYALVEKHLKAQFLFLSVRGRLYHVAMGRRLAWPEVRWYDKGE